MSIGGWSELVSNRLAALIDDLRAILRETPEHDAKRVPETPPRAPADGERSDTGLGPLKIQLPGRLVY
jgi:hypothetical protein